MSLEPFTASCGGTLCCTPHAYNQVLTWAGHRRSMSTSPPAVSDSEILRVRDAYAQWQSAKVDFEYGPLRGYPREQRGIMNALWREVIDPIGRLVDATRHKVGDALQVVDAPSPWHAYFYLRMQQQHLFRAGQPFGAPANERDPPAGDHLFFRGQRCASWTFSSPINRCADAARPVERRAVLALREYFWMMFAASEDLASNTARCFAQHYGIATDLVDITCDADIALWFATHPFKTNADPKEERQGVVRAFTWVGQQETTKTVALLAPPFVRNVYQQRGLFIDTSTTRGELVGSIMLNVRFPRDTVGGEFRVIRNGAALDVWPPADKSESDLIAWARKVAKECTSDDAVARRARADRDTSSFPRFWLDRELHNFEGCVEKWVSMLDWVLPGTCVTAISVSGGAAPMRYLALQPKVRQLVQANPTFFRAFTHATEEANFSGLELLKEILAVARDELEHISPIGA
jgi:hypothetical protein